MISFSEKYFHLFHPASIAKRVVDIIYPSKCLSCKKILHDNGNLCSECWKDMIFITPPHCKICGFPFDYDLGSEAICGQCLDQSPSYSKARAVFVYNHHSKSIITPFKYADKTYASKTFAKWMAQIGKPLLDDSDFLVPVPLHRLRLFQRKYNQSALLANALRKHCNSDVLVDALIRIRNTPAQTSLSKVMRKKNVKSAFQFNSRYANIIQGKSVTLIDDVVTTGATVDACSRQLLKAGASNVNVLTIAKTTQS